MINKLYTDGGARGNPGPAGIGGLIIGKNQIIKKKFSKYIGKATNNQAEYRALIYGLRLAQKAGLMELDCYLDSELVVKQINKQYKVKNEHIKTLYQKLVLLIPSFKKITFTHITRDKNSKADKLVNQAIDQQGPQKS